MMYIDNEVLEKMIMTIVEGFDRIEKKLDRMGRVKDLQKLGNTGILAETRKEKMNVGVSICGSYANFVS